MKVLILCVVLGVLAAQIEAFQRVTSLAPRHAYTSRMAGQANDEMDECRNSGVGRFLRRKGAALAITAGMLAGPRAAGARGFGRKGNVVEKPSEDVLEMVDDESDEYARASGGSVTSPSSSSMKKKEGKRSLFGRRKAKVEVVVEEEDYDDEYADEYEDDDEEEDGARAGRGFGSFLSAVDDGDMSRKLTNVGLGTAIGTTLYVVMSDGSTKAAGSSSSKKRNKGGAGTRTKPPTYKSKLDLNDIPSFESSTTRSRLHGSMGSKLGAGEEKEKETKKKTMMNDYDDADEDGDLFGSSPTNAPAAARKGSITSRMTQDAPEEEEEEGLWTTPAPAPAPAPAPVAVAVAPPTPAPAPAPKKKGLLGRIFSKPGAGRPTDLGVALKDEDDASYEFRATVAAALNSYVPSEIFSEWSLDDNAGVSVQRSATEEQKAQQLKSVLDDSGLSEQDAADAFAEVANAMLATVTERAAACQSSSKKGSEEEGEEVVLARLDDLADFVGGAGAVFAATVPNAVIEPVQYNGKAKKGALENLYLSYLKSSMSLDGMMGMLGAAAGTDNNGSDGDESSSSSGKSEEEQASAAAAAKAEERSNKLGRLQQVFAIKEKKRASLEGRVMKDLFMNMAKGEGGMPDLGGLMEGMMGSAGGGGGGDSAAMEEMLKSLGSGDMSAFEGMAGAMPEGMPDLGDMSEEEMQAMSKDAVGAVKQSLADGSITRKDVIELEKIMGMDVQSLSKMIDAGQIDKQKLASMGPEFAEMLDVFKQLAKIK